ncbi:MAG TPA: DMT family transporter [Sphingomonas sp.]|uniref:DMT family transporter n=1 Tax=Sphingomonas sp. TaxID=28214 RepID=UPI002C234F59|nr:DMT family transporter [Sphingomonas sp.]HMI18679.1 DMT family transporter [Sphingomonas sp.]
MSKLTSPVVAFGVACLGIATFSCMDAIMKRVSIDIGAYNAMLWRSIIGLLLSAPLFLVARVQWPDRGRLLLHVKRSGAAGISVLLFFWGLVRVPMAEGIALSFLSPILALLLAAPMLGEKVGKSAISACLLAFAGVIVIVLGKAHEGGGPAALHGAIAIIIAGLFYAYNLVLLRRSALLAGPIEITFFTNLVFTGLYLIGAPIGAAWLPLISLPLIGLAAGLAVVSSLLLAWAYARAEAQRLVPVEFTAFLWAAILGAIVFGEKLLPLTIAGAAMIIAGCVIAARGRQTPLPSTEAAS